MRIVVVSGGFDPIHSGHVRMIREAAKLGDELIVLVNTDEWLFRKKGYASMLAKERMEIVSAIDGVGAVLLANDKDGTVCESLREIAHQLRPDDAIVFCNGGDRGRDNTPESDLVKKLGGEMVFGVGGEEKTNSSSVIWPKHSIGKVDRLWGTYYDHFRNDSCVFKTLEILPFQRTSLQRHATRDEVWYVERGEIVVTLGEFRFVGLPGASYFVPREVWHQVETGVEGATIREMQIGICNEYDIERKE